MTGAEIDASLAIGDRGLRSFLTAFAITQIVEVPIYVAALGRRPPLRSGRARDGEGESEGAKVSARDSEGARDGEGEGAKVSARGSVAARGAVAFGASLLTHPIVWFVVPALAMHLYTNCVLSMFGGRALGILGRTLVYGALAEGFAVGAEALYLRAFGVRRALAWSVAANAASVVVGTLVVWGLDR